MSLNQLLVIGKSISDLKDRPNRYKMRALHPLPDFGRAKAGKNPLRMDSASSPQDVSNQKNTTKNQLRSASARPDQNTMNPQAVFRPNEYAKAGGLTSGAKNAGARVRRTFWSIVKRHWPPFKRQRFLETPVQEELTLASVRPVCNDLNESDLEIIRGTKSRSTNPFTGSIRSKAKSAQAQSAAGQVWSRITERLFGS